MFGLSRRRMKIGRLKVHLGDSTQGTRSPMRPSKRLGNHNGESTETPLPPNCPADDLHFQTSAAACNLSKFNSANNDNWAVVSTSGENPRPRAHHAAAVVGSKMVVVGGESGHELLDDTQVLSLDKLTWAAAAPKVNLSPTALPRKIPACKGHNLISWGKKMLLIGGKAEPMADRISVWSFDVETECWSLVEAKGDVPSARSGHTVARAGTHVILFGGEDLKGRKLNDLHMLDMKSSMWLPVTYTGTGPSPRCNHVAALYDNRILFVFGGQSKSRILNDLYSLDFEMMIWSRIKIQGHHPSPRAGCRGVLCGTKWYISGGGSKKKRYAETLVFDIVKLEMSVAVTSTPTSIVTNKGFSLVSVHHKEKVFLVAFGGAKKEPSNQVEILIMEKDEKSTSWRLASDKDPSLYESFPAGSMELASHLKSNCPPCSINSVGTNSLASAIGQHNSARRSLSESNVEPQMSNASVSLRKQFHHEGERVSVVKLQKALEDEKYKETDDSSQVAEQKNKIPETVVKVDTAGGVVRADDTYNLDSQSSNSYQKYGTGNPPPESDDVISPETDTKPSLTTPSNRYQLYEAKIATLVRKNVQLEGQLATALVSHENTEKNLSSTLKTSQELELKLADALKEVEGLKEKVASLELAQEEANNLSNVVHSDNVRLEHDVAFLKAVLDDTQKELHSTRGVLAGERARAFQLQFEVFHLKQRLQSMETRAPTPRKPFQVQEYQPHHT